MLELKKRFWFFVFAGLFAFFYEATAGIQDSTVAYSGSRRFPLLPTALIFNIGAKKKIPQL
jgi:hypothetical protein